MKTNRGIGVVVTRERMPTTAIGRPPAAGGNFQAIDVYFEDTGEIVCYDSNKVEAVE